MSGSYKFAGTVQIGDRGVLRPSSGPNRFTIEGINNDPLLESESGRLLIGASGINIEILGNTTIAPTRNESSSTLPVSNNIKTLVVSLAAAPATTITTFTNANGNPVTLTGTILSMVGTTTSGGQTDPLPSNARIIRNSSNVIQIDNQGGTQLDNIYGIIQYTG